MFDQSLYRPVYKVLDQQSGKYADDQNKYAGYYDKLHTVITSFLVQIFQRYGDVKNPQNGVIL
jgi:hypothetical protein